jgi:hypothetical protein
MYGVGLSGGIRFLSSFLRIDSLVQSSNICSRRQPTFFLFRKEYWLNSTSDNHSFVYVAWHVKIQAGKSIVVGGNSV